MFIHSFPRISLSTADIFLLIPLYCVSRHLFYRNTKWMNNICNLFSAECSQLQVSYFCSCLFFYWFIIPWRLSFLGLDQSFLVELVSATSLFWLCDSQKMLRMETPVTMTHAWRLLQVPAQKLSLFGFTHQQCQTVHELWILLISAKVERRKKRTARSLPLVTVFSLQQSELLVLCYSL